MNILDRNQDVTIQPFNNGIMLTSSVTQGKHHLSSYLGKSIRHVFNLSCNVFFLKKSDIIFHANDKQINFFNLEKPEDVIEKSIHHFFDKQISRSIVQNNINILQKNKFGIFEEGTLLPNSEIKNAGLSIKLPWYNKNGQTIGVFGFSIIYGRDNLAEALMQIYQLDLLNSSSRCFSLLKPLKIKEASFTLRESECIKLTIRGKTAKEIAAILNISHRTVEYYLENIKSKLNVHSKRELIDLAIDYIH